MELEEGGWEEEEGCLMRFLITESAARRRISHRVEFERARSRK